MSDSLEANNTRLGYLLYKEGSKISKKCAVVNKHLSRYFKFSGYFLIKLKVRSEASALNWYVKYRNPTKNQELKRKEWSGMDIELSFLKIFKQEPIPPYSKTDIIIKRHTK